MLLSVEFVSSGKQRRHCQDNTTNTKSNGYQKQQFDDDSDLPFWCNKKAAIGAAFTPAQSKPLQSTIQQH